MSNGRWRDVFVRTIYLSKHWLVTQCFDNFECNFVFIQGDAFAFLYSVLIHVIIVSDFRNINIAPVTKGYGFTLCAQRVKLKVKTCQTNTPTNLIVIILHFWIRLNINEARAMLCLWVRCIPWIWEWYLYQMVNTYMHAKHDELTRICMPNMMS